MTKKISELPAATTPLAGTELVEIVQGGANKQVPASDIGGVQSVNGQTGAVVLDAADVGAVSTVVAGSGVTVDSTDPQNPVISAAGGGGGSGDVVGPVGVTDENLAVFDGGSGKKIKDGGVKVSDLTADFVGDSGSGGAAGRVPAPGAGDAATGKFLKADGSWDVPAGGGGGLPTPVASTYLRRADDNSAYETKTAQQVADELSPLLPSVPIGGYVTVQIDITGAQEPSSEHFIRLKSGLTGAGQYNEGKLASESVSGSAPLIDATAVIDDGDSPLYGQTVHLIEDERRFLRAGSPGTLQDDAFQGHTFELDLWLSGGASTVPGGGAGELVYTYKVVGPVSDGVNGTPRTANETRMRNIGVAVYMRIK